MNRVGQGLGRSILRALVWLVRTPIALGVRLATTWAVRRVLGEAIVCATCGSEIPLLGLHECGRCGYAWYGHFFTRCDACGDVPPYIECPTCGASTINPLMFG